MERWIGCSQEDRDGWRLGEVEGGRRLEKASRVQPREGAGRRREEVMGELKDKRFKKARGGPRLEKMGRV